MFDKFAIIARLLIGTLQMAVVGTVLGAHAESMDAMQRLLVQRHGSVVEPVRQAGLTDVVIGQLHSRLVVADG